MINLSTKSKPGATLKGKHNLPTHSQTQAKTKRKHENNMEQQFGFNQQFTTEICGRTLKYHVHMDTQSTKPIVKVCLYNEKYELTRIEFDQIFYTPTGFVFYSIKQEAFWNKNNDSKLTLDEWGLFYKFINYLLSKEDFINAFCEVYYKMYN